MPNISIRSDIQTNASASASSLSINKPSGTVVGDLMLVIGFRDLAFSGGIADNNGSTNFTLQYEAVETTNGHGLSIFYRRIQSGDPGSFSFVFTGETADTYFSLAAITFADPNPTEVFDVAPSNSTRVHEGVDEGDINTVSVTSTVNNSIHIIIGSREGPSVLNNNITNYTKLIDGGPTFTLFSVWSRVITPAGSTGVKTLTGTGSGSSMSFSFIVKNSSATTTNQSTSGSVSGGGALSAFVKLPKFTVKIG